MSTTIENNDNNAIDEKKDNTESNLPDFKAFIQNYTSSIILQIAISIFIIGGIGLYTAKVTQANLLPDNIELEPYTNFARVVKDIPIDMNIIQQNIFAENKDILSQKAIFNSREYLDSFNDSFLCKLKKYATPDSGLFANGTLYFSKVYESIIASNFYAINSIFFYMNYLPESLIMILCGLFGKYIFGGLCLFNYCIIIFYYVVNVQELFRNESEDKPGFWEASKDISFFRMKNFLFFILWAIIYFYSLLFMPIVTTVYALISPLYAKYKVSSNGEQRGIFDFIKDTFIYKRLLFFMLCTASLVSNGITYLGPIYLIGIVIAILYAYYMGLYKIDMPEVNTNGFTANITKIKQAFVVKEMVVKQNNLCPEIPILNNEQIGGIQKPMQQQQQQQQQPKQQQIQRQLQRQQQQQQQQQQQLEQHSDLQQLEQQQLEQQQLEQQLQQQQLEQQQLEQQPEVQAGGKRKKIHTTKKYIIIVYGRKK
jgi:hypothetical protein